MIIIGFSAVFLSGGLAASVVFDFVDEVADGATVWQAVGAIASLAVGVWLLT